MSTKVGVVSLGCDKNRVDTEVMLENLAEGGYEITADPSEADVIIVNTCAFLQSSRQESIDTVLEMAHFKQNGKCKKVIITGCLGQKFGQEVFDGLTEADAVAGVNSYGNICDIVADTLADKRKLYTACNSGITFGKRILTTATHVAYLKIADGCDNYCTYCLIPYIRGHFRSVPMEEVVAHAKSLAEQGVKELILVAQDTTKYGKDLYGKPQLVELLHKLSEVEGIRWIRLLYCYPELMSDELIAEIAANDKIVNYVDVPLQHVDDAILKRMNRKSNHASIVELFGKLAESGISVRSTFICGFPGETDETIQTVADFLTATKMRNVGFFAYSREEGTKAYDFPDQVPQRKKNAYVKKLYKVQQKVVEELGKADVGQTYKCIVDNVDELQRDGKYCYVGRTYFMAPEIDGTIFISSDKPLQIGEVYDVTVTEALGYDLVGEARS